MKRMSLLFLLSLSMVVSHRLAHADAATAEALFREGRALVKEGKFQEACAKFEASQKLDPSSGTLLNLAECSLREGKLATAWATFISASTLATSQGNASRAADAKRRAGELEPKLSYLQLHLASRPEGLRLQRDQVTLEAAAFETKIPVDPGSHRILASAPGYREWSQQIDVTAPGVFEVNIPSLERLPPTPSASASTSSSVSAAPTAPPSAPSTPLTSPPHSPVLGYAIGGVGLVLVGIGAYFGLSAMSNYSKAEDLCPTHKGCPEGAKQPSEDASRDGTISTITTGLGLVALVGGTVLILTSPKKKETSSLRWSPQVTPSFQGATLGGTF